MNTLPASALVLSSTFLATAVGALLLAELKSSRLGVWLIKPVASTLFVITALLAGALASSYGRLILLGLLLSWLGDVFLISKRQLFFIVGLGSFLLAHVAFSGAFLLHSLEVLPMTFAATGTVVVAIIILRWLWPHLLHNFRPAVVSYLAAISLMVVLASGTMAAVGPQLLIGAVMFAVSDIFVARERFFSPSVANRLWGLPLYYAAQLIFALSTQDP